MKQVVVVPSLSRCSKAHTSLTGSLLHLNSIQSSCSGATQTKLHHVVLETPYYWAVRMLSGGLRRMNVCTFALYNDVL